MAREKIEKQYIQTATEQEALFGADFPAKYAELKAMRQEALKPFYEAWEAFETDTAAKLGVEAGKAVKLHIGFGESVGFSVVDAEKATKAKATAESASAKLAKLGITVKAPTVARIVKADDVKAKGKRA